MDFEFFFLLKITRSATVKAKENCELLLIDSVVMSARKPGMKRFGSKLLIDGMEVSGSICFGILFVLFLDWFDAFLMHVGRGNLRGGCRQI